MMCSLRYLIMVLFACSHWWLPSYSNLTSEKQKPQGGYDDDGVSISPPTVGNSYSCPYPYPCTPQPLQPPPPPPPRRRGSAIYAAPPPPQAATNCPPVAPVTCCQNTPPNPMPNNGYPFDYGNYTQSSSFSRIPCSLIMMWMLPFVCLFGV
ncbi:hypothetical protein L1987_84724 [Smallanthus sonchifolius]|uniref:Uncharacterized protein n=1 Tax=Smallanthus sonchifolius TaxID=185202 RepID=A0ACB8XW52_9ASTR|nr:hypothetical protein L1987_84724 [Smallanthus sonchifolius]